MSWRVWIEPRPRGRFLVRTRNSAGRNGKSNICSTKKVANELRTKWERSLERSDLGLQDGERNVHEMWEEYKQELQRGEQTHYLSAHNSVIPQYLEDKKTVADLTTESIQVYRTWLINNTARPTVRSRLRHLSAWLSWCVEKNYLMDSPFKRINVPDYVPQPKFLTDEEIEKLDRAATGEMKLMWRLAYMTGLRQANVLALRGDQIENDMAIISRTKGKRPISAPLGPEIMDLLPKPLPKGPLFQNWNKASLRWAFGLLKLTAGVRRGITWHMARHTFVKKALQAGLTTFEVMKFTGHVSPISMMPYANFEMDRLRDRHKLIKFPTGDGGQTGGQ